ncbi:MAG: PH domain-containing protein [Phycisphaerales bacterium]
MTTGAGSVAVGADGAASVPGIDDGETVILNIRPSGWFIVIGSLRELMLIGLLGLPAWLLSGSAYSPVGRGLTETVVVTLVVVRLLWQTLDWACRSYILTDRRVIREFGVLQRRRYEAALRNIQALDVTRSVPERLLSLGTVCFSAASAAGVPEACWVSVSNPDEVARIVREAVRRYGAH